MQLMQVRPMKVSVLPVWYSVISQHFSSFKQVLEVKLFAHSKRIAEQKPGCILYGTHGPLPPLYSVSLPQLTSQLAAMYPELTLPLFSGSCVFCVLWLKFLLVVKELDCATVLKLVAYSYFLLSRDQPALPHLSHQWEADHADLPPALARQHRAGGKRPTAADIPSTPLRLRHLLPDCWDRFIPPTERQRLGLPAGHVFGAQQPYVHDSQGKSRVDQMNRDCFNVTSAKITRSCQFGDDLPGPEMEKAWNALVCNHKWSNNLRTTLQFLISLCGVSSDTTLLPYVRHLPIVRWFCAQFILVILYLFRSRRWLSICAGTILYKLWRS